MPSTQSKFQVVSAAILIGVLSSAGTGAASAAEVEKRHALSLIDKPAYGPDFKHFKWVNPDAPR
ncbi:MAG: hypothetical protein AAFR23_09165, partial [Pseudomonadota bacterium]